LAGASDSAWNLTAARTELLQQNEFMVILNPMTTVNYCASVTTHDGHGDFGGLLKSFSETATFSGVRDIACVNKGCCERRDDWCSLCASFVWGLSLSWRSKVI
jgi:hypothetical protein